MRVSAAWSFAGGLLLTGNTACNLLMGADAAELDTATGGAGVGAAPTGGSAASPGGGLGGGGATAIGGGAPGTGGEPYGGDGGVPVGAGGDGGAPLTSPCDVVDSGFACVSVVTEAIHVLKSETPGSCPSGLEPMAVHTCEPCQCEPTAAGTCVAQATLYAKSNCTGTATTIADTGACASTSVDGQGGNMIGVRSSVVPGDAGTCGRAVSSDGAELTLCIAEPVVGCETGSACVAAEATCVLFAGPQACPADRPTRTEVAEQSGCGCACSVATHACLLAGEIETSSSSSQCASTDNDIAADGACHSTGLSTVMSIDFDTSVSSSVTCGLPVAGTADWTLCCPE